MTVYNSAVTVWKREEEGRTVKWRRIVVSPVRIECTRGASASASGDATARVGALYVPKSIGQHISLKDKVRRGTVDAETPPANAYTVMTEKAVAIDCAVHHYEFGLS